MLFYKHEVVKWWIHSTATRKLFEIKVNMDLESTWLNVVHAEHGFIYWSLLFFFALSRYFLLLISLVYWIESVLLASFFHITIRICFIVFFLHCSVMWGRVKIARRQNCTRGQNCTKGQNCTRIKLHERSNLHEDVFARRQICTKGQFCASDKFARRVKFARGQICTS